MHQPEIQRQKSQLGRSKKCNESITYLSSVFTLGATFTATLIRLWRLTFLLDFGFLLNSSFRWLLFSPSVRLRSCSEHSFYGITNNRHRVLWSRCAPLFLFASSVAHLWCFTFVLDFCLLMNSSFRWFLFSPSIPLLVTRIASRITGRSCSGHSFYNGTTTNRLTLFYSFFARFFAPVTLIDISKLIVMHFFAYKYFSSAMLLTLPSSSAA